MATDKSYLLPSDIELYEKKLIESRIEIQRIRKTSDGLWGPIGLDALLGIVPVAGDLYSLLAGSWLFILARRVNAPVGDLFLLISLSTVDFMFGLVPLGGDILDVFFRVHNWFGGRLLKHVDRHLSLIEKARLQITQNQDIDLASLRNSLFKNN